MTHLAFIIISISLAALYGAFLLFRKGLTLWVVGLLLAFVATGCLEAFDYLSLLRPEKLYLYKKWALFAESFLPLGWLFFSQRFARTKGMSHIQWLFLLIAALLPVAAVSIPLEQFFYSPDFGEEKLLFLGNPGYFFYITLMAVLIVSLVNLEITLMSAQRADRWKIKFEVIGAGVIIGFFIVYYSQSLLYRSIDMGLAPTRAAMPAVGIVLMAFSRLRRGDAGGVRLSPDMAYRSVVIFVVGLYFIGIALVGEGLKYFGESAQRSVLTVVAFAGFALLMAIFLSDRVKRRIKVTLHKHFYRSKYDYRQQWLEFTSRIGAARDGDDLSHKILSFFCEVFGFQGAGLYLEDRERGRYVQTARYERCALVGEIESKHPLMEKMRAREWIVDLDEEDPAGILTESSTSRCFYLVPLRTETQLEGMIALEGALNPSEKLTYEDYDLMKALGRQALAALMNVRLSQELSAAREMELMGRVSAFVLHDLKNLVSNLGLVVDNARDYIDDPEFQQDMMETLQGTVDKMKGLIQRLRNLQEKRELKRDSVELRELVDEALGQVSHPAVKISGAEVEAEVDAEEIRKVVLNLVLNALDATGNKGPVQVEVGRSVSAFIRVSDEGEGMSEAFMRSRLFRPFETTKKKGFGIGLYQCRQIVEAHGGRIEVESEEGRGSTFTVWLP
ncbi:MAG: XrtA/PEP-CTERM system histidine kinase PrsK [Geoalkalibacter sp.]|jgi:putative PEP-CTERM system histidine kinase|uniref:XrtA/PEP-CTERM system histidine kinase PrsK n=1 Tax=Geoalkalibacter sp. TaxID=3041440 RepID=UPI002A9E589A|nr:XrtA/PEP-CTERM system histidine kinase PrsK [Thermodesulfobacteriota bacterium]